MNKETDTSKEKPYRSLGVYNVETLGQALMESYIASVSGEVLVKREGDYINFYPAYNFSPINKEG